jgi:hypothetical protein
MTKLSIHIKNILNNLKKKKKKKNGNNNELLAIIYDFND